MRELLVPIPVSEMKSMALTISQSSSVVSSANINSCINPLSSSTVGSERRSVANRKNVQHSFTSSSRGIAHNRMVHALPSVPIIASAVSASTNNRSAAKCGSSNLGQIHSISPNPNNIRTNASGIKYILPQEDKTGKKRTGQLSGSRHEGLRRLLSACNAVSNSGTRLFAIRQSGKQVVHAAALTKQQEVEIMPLPKVSKVDIVSGNMAESSAINNLLASNTRKKKRSCLSNKRAKSVALQKKSLQNSEDIDTGTKLSDSDPDYVPTDSSYVKGDLKRRAAVVPDNTYNSGSVSKGANCGSTEVAVDVGCSTTIGDFVKTRKRRQTSASSNGSHLSFKRPHLADRGGRKANGSSINSNLHQKQRLLNVCNRPCYVRLNQLPDVALKIRQVKLLDFFVKKDEEKCRTAPTACNKRKLHYYVPNHVREARGLGIAKQPSTTSLLQTVVINDPSLKIGTKVDSRSKTCDAANNLESIATATGQLTVADDVETLFKSTANNSSNCFLLDHAYCAKEIEGSSNSNDCLDHSYSALPTDSGSCLSDVSEPSLDQVAQQQRVLDHLDRIQQLKDLLQRQQDALSATLQSIENRRLKDDSA